MEAIFAFYDKDSCSNRGEMFLFLCVECVGGCSVQVLSAPQEHCTTVAWTFTEHLLKLNRFEGLFQCSSPSNNMVGYCLDDGNLCCEGPFNSIFSWTWWEFPNFCSVLWSIWALVLHDQSSTCMVCLYWEYEIMHKICTSTLYQVLSYMWISASAQLPLFTSVLPVQSSAAETAWVSNLDGRGPGRLINTSNT